LLNGGRYLLKETIMKKALVIMLAVVLIFGGAGVTFVSFPAPSGGEKQSHASLVISEPPFFLEIKGSHNVVVKGKYKAGEFEGLEQSAVWDDGSVESSISLETGNARLEQSFSAQGTGRVEQTIIFK
jgi:hypothetical protein